MHQGLLLLAVFGILPELLANFALARGVIPQLLRKLRQCIVQIVHGECEIRAGRRLLLMSRQCLLGLINQRLRLLSLAFQ